MLGRPGFAVDEIRHETFEVAVLVPFGYARALHHSARAFFHAAITRNRYVAARTVGPRHQLPTSSPAERTILKSHNRCRLLPGVLNLCTAYERGGSAASRLLGKLWKRCASDNGHQDGCAPIERKLLCYGPSLTGTRTARGLVRTIAWRCGCGRSSMRDATRESSCCTTCANSPICFSIVIIFSRMFRMISIPARFTPMSRARVRITSRRSRSLSVYSRVFPCEREGFSRPTRSYSRSVCGCSLYSSATALIM